MGNCIDVETSCSNLTSTDKQAQHFMHEAKTFAYLIEDWRSQETVWTLATRSLEDIRRLASGKLDQATQDHIRQQIADNMVLIAAGFEGVDNRASEEALYSNAVPSPTHTEHDVPGTITRVTRVGPGQLERC